MRRAGGRKEYLIKTIGILLLRHGRTMEQAKAGIAGKSR